MSAPILLDTCTVIWLMSRAAMSQKSLDAIGRAHGDGIYVSPITAWEIGILVAKAKLQLTLSPEAWFEEFLSLPGIRLADLSPKVLMDSSFLPGSPPRDPADRIIAATARLFGHVVVTRDDTLIRYAQAGHIRAIAC